jgi:hypothetical protein
MPETDALALSLRERAERIEHHVWNAETPEALGQLGAAMETMQELAGELVEAGIRAGMTQKRIAGLLGVPASTLRGAKREFSQ